MSAASATTAFKLADASSYDAFARDFEQLTERFSRPIAADLIDFADLAAAKRVLDVGCGTGILTRLAGNLAPRAQIVGADLSDGMLAQAVLLAADAGLGERVRFQAADAEHLPFADHGFDRVISLFALRHFPDPAAALRQMFRVLEPGGRCAVGVGAGPPVFSLAFPAAAARRIREALASVVGRGPLKAPDFLDSLLDEHLGPAPAVETAAWTHGVADYSRPVAELMRAAGFVDIRTRWTGQSSVLTSVDEFWKVQLVFSTHARKRYPLALPEAQARLREAFEMACREHLHRGGQLVYRSGALLSSGTRPR